MIKFVIFWGILFAIFAALVFFWQKLTKTDVEVAGKIFMSAILAALIAVALIFLETQ